MAQVGDGVVGTSELDASAGAGPTNRMSGGCAGDALIEQSQPFSGITRQRSGSGVHQGGKWGVHFCFCGATSGDVGSFAIAGRGEQLGGHEPAVDSGYCLDDGCESSFVAMAGEEVDLSEAKGDVGVAGGRFEGAQVPVSRAR
jgi:hypothetical protein